jgi:PAS domain S-box-containing protein
VDFLTVMQGNGAHDMASRRRGWMWLGAEGLCYDVSDSVVQMLGVHKSNFLVRNWVKLVHVDDRDRIRDLANQLQRDELPAPVRLRFVSLDGKSIWLEIRFMRRRDTRRSQPQADLIIAKVQTVHGEAA